MPKRLSEKLVIKNLKERGFTLLEKYKNSRVKHKIEDKNGLIASIRIDSIISGHTKSCQGKTIYEYLDKSLFIKTNPQIFYILGFLLADGCVSKNKNNYQLILGLKENQENLDLFKYIINFLEIPDKKITRTQNSIRLSYNINYDIVKILKKYSIFPKKTYSAYFSQCIPKMYLGDFIRGFFDGDGCFHFKKDNRRLNSYRACVAYSAKNKELLYGLQKIIGGNIRFNNNKTGGFYSLKISSFEKIKKFYNLIYKNIETNNRHYFLSKKEKFDKYFKIINKS